MQYQIMFYGGLAGAVITLSISIYIYIKLNITQVIEHLTGFSFRKLSKNMRKNYGQSREVTEKRTTTNEIKIRKKVVEQEQAWTGGVAATELLKNEGVESTALLYDDGVEETSLLSEETTLLTLDEAETSILTEIVEKNGENSFVKQVDVMIVHTKSII